MKIKRVVYLTGVIASVLSITSFAGGWNWLDSNQDGTFECYYFNDDGTYLTNTTTPDGYQVDSSGAWIKDGIVQVKNGGSGASTQGSVTTQVLSINPNYRNSADKSNAAVNSISISIGGSSTRIDDLGDIYGKDLFLGLDNRDYTLDEFKKVLENSGATKIECETEIDYHADLGRKPREVGSYNPLDEASYREWYFKNERIYGIKVRNVIHFKLGELSIYYYGPAQVKEDGTDIVRVYKANSGETYEEASDFVYTINPYSIEWNVSEMTENNDIF